MWIKTKSVSLRNKQPGSNPPGWQGLSLSSPGSQEERRPLGSPWMLRHRPVSCPQKASIDCGTLLASTLRKPFNNYELVRPLIIYLAAFVSTSYRLATNHIGELVESQSETAVPSVMLLDARRVLHPDLAPRSLLLRMRVELAVRRLPWVPLVVMQPGGGDREE